MIDNHSIRKTFISGSLWTAFGTYSKYLLQIIITAILARILGPEDYGVLAIGLVYIGFALILSESGITTAIIQKRDLSDEEQSSIFWITVALGIIITCLTLAIAPLAETFFAYKGIAKVLDLLSISLFLATLSSVPEGRLRRDCRFKTLSIIDIISSLLSGVSAIVLAYLEYGYMALVVQQIVLNGARFSLMLFMGHWQPKITYRAGTINKIAGFSGNVLGFSAINYWAINGDNFLIGKVLGAVQLGYYSQAYKLLWLSQHLFLGVINQTLLPVLSGVQNDLRKIRKIYLIFYKLLLLLGVPLGVFMNLMSEEIIKIIWGQKWINSIPAFEWLSLIICLQPVAHICGSFMLAINRSDVYFRTGIITTAIFLLSFIMTVNNGIVALSCGYFVANLLVTPLVVIITYKLIDGNIVDLLMPIIYALAAALILTIIWFGTKLFIANYPDIIKLLIIMLQSIVIFAILAINKKYRKIIFNYIYVPQD